MINWQTFTDRLSHLMLVNGELNGKTLAQKLGISPQTVTRYLSMQRTPTCANLILIADYFNRSTDFLLGLEEENPELVFKSCPPFSEQIVFLANYFKKSYRSFFREVKIPESTFFEWKKGESVPTVESIEKIAAHFDCGIDFVLGRES